jgi:predicted Zn finger-like uncharacterized protein
VRFTCPSCAKSYRLPPERLGANGRAQVNCPNCKTFVIVRSTGGEVLESTLATGPAPEAMAAAAAATQGASTSAVAEAAPASSGAAAAGGWFVAVGRDKQGPWTDAELGDRVAAGTVQPSSLVWRRGMAAWAKLTEVPELAAVLPTTAAAAVRQSQPVAPPVAERPVPKPSPLPKSNDPLDEAGPTLRGNVDVVKTATPAPDLGGLIPPKEASGDHTGKFFGGLGEVELQMPDAGKHKPSKEEYQGMLQEFSVMFRIDRRSKRQKMLIGVLAAALVVGVVAFGVTLVVKGRSKRALLRDSTEILKTFALQYTTTVTVQVDDDDKPAAVAEGQPAPAVKKRDVETSGLAERLQKTVRKARKKVAQPQTGLVLAAPLAQDAETARRLKALQAQATMSDADRKRAEDALKGPGGRTEVKLTNTATGEAVTKEQLQRFCDQKVPALRGCGASAGVGSFSVTFVVNGDGDVTQVKAYDDGKVDDQLSSCSSGKLKGRFGPQPGGKTTDFKCKVE